MEKSLCVVPLEELMEKIKQVVREEVSSNNNNQTIVEDKYIRTDEAAKMFRVSKKTIKNWRDSNQIPFFRIKRSIFFKKSDLIERLNQTTRRRGKKPTE